ncbi:MAG: adenosylmethionine--8-amino-7-oxononanoate transaminase [Smithella sp.]
MKTDMETNKQLEADDLKYIWHPFTQMQEYSRETPLIIAAGEGCLLQDIYGNNYIDGVSSLWTNVHGHRKKELDDAATEQLGKIAHSTLLGISNIPAIKLAKKLISIAPAGLTKVFYSDNGSTSVEIAVKMAFQYHQQAALGDHRKTKFITLKNAYHGDTIGSVSVGGIDLFHATYNPLLFPTIPVQSPHCYRCPFGKERQACDHECFRNLEETVIKHARETAAFIIEPLVQGAAGILLQPPGYLKRVRELCTEYNIFMIADEVAVGFGKTGTMFACDQEGITPDLMAVSKGIGGGYLPLAATLTTEKVYEGFLGKFEEFKTFFHGHTFTGNPLACAAALANIKLFEKESILEGLQEKIAVLTRALTPFSSLSHVGDVRQRGIMVGIELVEDKRTKKGYPPRQRVGHRVITEARQHGVLIRPLGDVIVLMPPLSITMDQLERLCMVTYEAIRTITEG